MSATLNRWSQSFGRILRGDPDRLETVVTADGPRGELGVPRDGDGVWSWGNVIGEHMLEGRLLDVCAKCQGIK
jgi:hypothetical protein